jgi:hypothetical protein
MSHRIENIKAGGDVYVVINDNQTKRDRSKFCLRVLRKHISKLFEFQLGPDSNSSSSTVSEYEIKRRRKITYFNGEGQKEWIPQHEVSKNLYH